MNKGPGGRWSIAAGALLSCVLALLVGALAPDHASRLGEARADSPPPPGTSLDMALTGTATASSTATGDPASNAIDGSASTHLVLDASGPAR